MKEKSNRFKLIQEVVDNSVNKEWDKAKLEWECTHQVKNTKGNCVCGHPLMNLYFITNKLNKNSLIVGSSCVRKFDNTGMNTFLDNIIKEQKEQDKLKKQYQLLKQKQANNNIPVSVRKEFLEKKRNEHVINEFEYKFYLDIWDRCTLTEKQLNFKDRLNTRLLNSINK